MDEQQEQKSDQGSVSSDPRCEEYLAGWKRAQADYQNLQKEVERERTEYVKYANERLLEQILPAFDQFSRALQHVPSGEDRKAWDNWLIGVRAVQSLWEQAASSVGLERIPTDGAFNPVLHEAVGEEAQDGQTAGSIVRTVEGGWKLHEKVLRPAKVIIAK